jgi:hypothetical protein
MGLSTHSLCSECWSWVSKGKFPSWALGDQKRIEFLILSWFWPWWFPVIYFFFSTALRSSGSPCSTLSRGVVIKLTGRKHELKLVVIGTKTSITGARKDLGLSLYESLKLVSEVSTSRSKQVQQGCGEAKGIASEFSTIEGRSLQWSQAIDRKSTHSFNGAPQLSNGTCQT